MSEDGNGKNRDQEIMSRINDYINRNLTKEQILKEEIKKLRETELAIENIGRYLTNEETVKEVTEKCNELEREINFFKREENQLKELLEKYKKEKPELSKRINKIKNNIELIVKEESKVKERQSKIEEQNKKLDEEEQKIENRKSEQKIDITEWDIKHSTAEKKYKFMKSNVDRVEKELEKLREKKQKALAEKTELDKELEDKKKEISNLKAEVKKLVEERRENGIANRRLGSTRKAIEEDIERKKKQKDNLVKEIQTKEEKLESKNKKLEDISKKMEIENIKLEKVTGELEDMNKSLETKEKYLVHLKEDIKSKEEKLESKKEDIKSKEEELENSIEKGKQAVIDLKAKETEVSKIDDSLKDLKQKKTIQLKNYEDFTNNLNKKKEEEKEQLELELEELREEYNDKLEDKKHEIDKIEKKLEDEKEELSKQQKKEISNLIENNKNNLKILKETLDTEFASQREQLKEQHKEELETNLKEIKEEYEEKYLEGSISYEEDYNKNLEELRKDLDMKLENKLDIMSILSEIKSIKENNKLPEEMEEVMSKLNINELLDSNNKAMESTNRILDISTGLPMITNNMQMLQNTLQMNTNQLNNNITQTNMLSENVKQIQDFIEPLPIAYKFMREEDRELTKSLIELFELAGVPTPNAQELAYEYKFKHEKAINRACKESDYNYDTLIEIAKFIENKTTLGVLGTDILIPSNERQANMNQYELEEYKKKNNLTVKPITDQCYILELSEHTVENTKVEDFTDEALRLSVTASKKWLEGFDFPVEELAYKGNSSEALLFEAYQRVQASENDYKAYEEFKDMTDTKLLNPDYFNEKLIFDEYTVDELTERIPNILNFTKDKCIELGVELVETNLPEDKLVITLPIIIEGSYKEHSVKVGNHLSKKHLAKTISKLLEHHSEKIDENNNVEYPYLTTSNEILFNLGNYRIDNTNEDEDSNTDNQGWGKTDNNDSETKDLDWNEGRDD